LDIDYWKECSNIEFFNGMRKELQKFREEREEKEERTSDTPKKKKTRKTTWGCGK
jgi:hypothetical protein